MKNIFLSLMAVAAILFSSCTNEDIEIKTSGRLYDVTLNVNTQNVYDAFDMTSKVTDEQLRDNSYKVGVFTYIYNASGVLVAQQKSTSSNFNMMTQTFKLEEGNYTVVNVETLVDPNKELMPFSWTIDGTNNLSSLKMSPKYIDLDYTDIFGTSTSTIIVNGAHTVNVVPTAVGSIIESYYLDYDKSNYIKEAFATRDVLESYSLDPAKTGSSKYSYDLSKSGFLNVRAEMETTSTVTEHNVIYIVDEKIRWIPCFKELADAGNSSWTYFTAYETPYSLVSGKTYYAGMKYVDDNTAYKTNFTSDRQSFVTWYNSVLGGESGVSFKEPFIRWNSSVSAVHSTMSSYTQVVGTSTRAEIQDGGLYVTAYEGKSPELLVMYMFTSATSGLMSSSIAYDASLVGEDAILGYLNNNYTYVSAQNGTYMYATSDYSTLVTLTEANGMWMMMFMDAASAAAKVSVPSFAANAAVKACAQKAKNNRSVVEPALESESKKAIHFFENLYK